MDKINVVMIEDNMADAMLIRKAIGRRASEMVNLTYLTTMAAGEKFLGEHSSDVDLILLDLGLPDTKGGLDTYRRIQDLHLDIPVVVLTGVDDHDLAMELIRQGAEDYVAKSRDDRFAEAIEFAVCRHHVLQAAKASIQKELIDKNNVIAWMSGDYSCTRRSGS